MIAFVIWIVFMALVVKLASIWWKSTRAKGDGMQPQSPTQNPPPVIRLQFAEMVDSYAVTALRARTPISYDEFSKLNPDGKRQTFSFKGAASPEIALAVRNVVECVLTGDVSRDRFCESANNALSPFGITLEYSHADLILHMALSTASSVAKDKEYANPIFRANNPYVGWVTAHDNRVRPNHFALDYRRIKTVFSQDDPLWELFREPLGDDCRCTRLSFSPERLVAMGLVVGNLADWYGRELEVELPGGVKALTAVLPDRELKQHPTLGPAARAAASRAQRQKRNR